MIEDRFWALLSLLRAVACNSRRSLGQKLARAWRLSQAHRYSTGFKSGAQGGSNAIWMYLDVSSQAVQIVPNQATAMRLQAIPDHRLRLLQVGLERLEEFDDLFLLDAALVQPEHAVGARESGDHRDVIPVELNNHRLKPEGLSYGLEVRIRVA